MASSAPAHPELLGQIDRLGTAIQSAPDNAELYIRRGELHRRHGDFDAAAADFDAARQRQPALTTLDFHEGRLALERGEPERAVKQLDRFLAHHPEHPGGWRVWAQAQQAMDQPRQAALGYGRAVAFSETPSPALYRQQVLAWRAVGEPGLAPALEAVDAGLARLGNEVGLLGLGADIALDAGLPNRALGYLEKLPPGLSQLPAWQARYERARVAAAR